MTGYVRKDTTNNIADGNVINATDLDNEFDGLQDAFNSTTGHNHDGTTGEGAPILAVGPTQDVVASATALTPKTTATVDIGSGSLKFKDLYLSGAASVGGNATISGTLAVTGVATLTAQPILSSLTASKAVFSDASKGLVSNDITGTGNVVMSNSATLVTPILGTPQSVTLTNGTGLPLTTGVTGTLPTANGGTGLTSFTANGVVYASSTSALATGSALTFSGSALGVNATSTTDAAISIKALTANYASVLEMVANNDNGAQYNNISSSTSGGTVHWRIGGVAGVSQLPFSIAGSEAMRLTSTGLGIGTSSPSDKLNLAGTSINNISLAISNASSGSYCSLSTYGGTAFGISGWANSTVLESVPASTGGLVLGSYSGSILFQTNARTNSMALDSAGNLGLGVTPSAWTTFKVMQLGNFGAVGGVDLTSMNMFANTFYDGSFKRINTAAASRYRMDEGHSWFTAPSGTAGAAISFTQAMTLDASGTLTVSATGVDHTFGGGSNANSSLRIMSNPVGATYYQQLEFLANGSNQMFIRNMNSELRFIRNATQQMTLDASGNLLVGTTNTTFSSNGIRLYANNSLEVVRDGGTTQSNVYLNKTSNDGEIVSFNRSGTQVGNISVTTSATAYNTTSDYRLKTVIGSVSDSGARIDALEPVEYTWNSNGERTRGFLAHKFQEVYAGSVTGTKDAVDADGKPMYQAMQAGSAEVIADLVAELQSLRKRLAAAGI